MTQGRTLTPTVRPHRNRDPARLADRFNVNRNRTAQTRLRNDGLLTPQSETGQKAMRRGIRERTT